MYLAETKSTEKEQFLSDVISVLLYSTSKSPGTRRSAEGGRAFYLQKFGLNCANRLVFRGLVAHGYFCALITEIYQ